MRLATTGRRIEQKRNKVNSRGSRISCFAGRLHAIGGVEKNEEPAAIVSRGLGSSCDDGNMTVIRPTSQTSNDRSDKENSIGANRCANPRCAEGPAADFEVGSL
jgi:hypothetical protein